MSTWRARQEGHGAVEVDGEAALDLVEDDALDLLAAVERLLELAPALLAARLVARQHGLAERILDALEIDFDLVADLSSVCRPGPVNSRKRHAAFGLQSDVDNGEILFDADDVSLDRRNLPADCRRRRIRRAARRNLHARVACGG